MRHRLDRLWYDVRAIWWYAWIVILVCAGVTAEAQTITLTEQGVYRTSVESGVPSYVVITEYDRLIDLRGDQPGPDPDGPDEPEEPDRLTKQVKAWADAVDDSDMAQKLALIYLQISQVVASGDLDLQSGPKALSAATDAVATPAWGDFGEHVGDEFRKRRQRGDISSDEHFVTFLKSVANGLELSATGSVAVDHAELLDVIFKVNAAIDGSRD